MPVFHVFFLYIKQIEFKHLNKQGFLIYNAAQNIFCTTGVTPTGPLVPTASFSPDKNKCAQYSSGDAKYYPYSKYTYFNGNCSTSGDCTDKDAPCVLYNGNPVDTYNTGTKTQGSVTCRFSSGCKSGFFTSDSDAYICGPASLSTATYYDVEDSSAGSASCKKIKGCISPYQRFFLGPTAQSGGVDKPDDGTDYDVKKLVSGDAHVTCLKAQGCVVPLYSQEACYYADGINYGPPERWTPENLGL